VSSDDIRTAPIAVEVPAPDGTPTIMIENNLNYCSSDHDVHRPWFIFDVIDPVAKFRMMGPDYDWASGEDYVEKGNDSSALVDEHVEGKSLPVMVYGYE
jgi:hypothetical protein